MQVSAASKAKCCCFHAFAPHALSAVVSSSPSFLNLSIYLTYYLSYAISMQPPVSWLTKLKATELHRLAVLIGTPCSGTKAVQLHGIQNALASLPAFKNGSTSQHGRDAKHLSLVSIDMGIRNLAYSHWTSSLNTSTANGVAQYEKPVLRAWRKINISTALESTVVTETSRRGEGLSIEDDGINTTAVKESFEPIDYADRAYRFIKDVVETHDPSNVLIERQRFRTGGNSAVQEWTIRVGVFEGMLYAVLRSLVAERPEYGELVVEPVLPARVNRYWLEGRVKGNRDRDGAKPGSGKVKAKEVKQMKIELVRKLLRDARSDANEALFTWDKDTNGTVSAFLGKGIKTDKSVSSAVIKGQRSKATAMELSKLDDLADSFLQGLAWIQWQNNRFKFGSHTDNSRPPTIS